MTILKLNIFIIAFPLNLSSPRNHFPILRYLRSVNPSLPNRKFDTIYIKEK